MNDMVDITHMFLAGTPTQEFMSGDAQMLQEQPRMSAGVVPMEPPVQYGDDEVRQAEMEKKHLPKKMLVKPAPKQGAKPNELEAIKALLTQVKGLREP